MESGGSPATVFLQWHICWPKLPVILLSTGICSLVLIHVSATIGSCGGFGTAGLAGAPGIAGPPGIPGADGGFGGVSGGSVYCLPCTSMPCTILMPRSLTATAGVVGGVGAPGIPGTAGGFTCGGVTPGGAGNARTSILT